MQRPWGTASLAVDLARGTSSYRVPNAADELEEVLRVETELVQTAISVVMGN